MITALIIVAIIIQYLVLWGIVSYLEVSTQLGKREATSKPIYGKYNWFTDENMWISISIFISFVCPFIGFPAVIVAILAIIFYNKKHELKFTNPMKWIFKEILAPRENV